MRLHLIKIWNDINDSVQELEGVGYGDNRGVIEALKEALGYLSDDIDDLEEEE
jgi:hypothetical protein